MGPNVEMIRAEGFRVIHGRIPARVRKELQEGVRKGELRHLKKDGLLQEVFFRPDISEQALSERTAAAFWAATRIARVLA